MSELVIAAIWSFGLGIMTTMHPCPFASNLAAISLISGWPAKKNRKVLNYLSFIIGYILALIALAFILNLSILSIPVISYFLQQVIAGLMGPLLIIAGMVLAGLIRLGKSGKNFLLKDVDLTRRSTYYLVITGSALALTFCPATATVFFGILIPLSVRHDQVYVFPIIYALGASFPIIIVSILVNLGIVKFLHDAGIKKVSIIAGWILILIGIYITLDQLFL